MKRAHRVGREHGHPARAVEEPLKQRPQHAGAAADLDNHPRPRSQHASRRCDLLGFGGPQADASAAGQPPEVEAGHHLRLGVDWQQQEERPGLVGMIDHRGTLLQRVGDGLGGVEAVAAAHRRGQLLPLRLHRSGQVLHVRTFGFGGGVAVDVPYADAVERGGERACEGVQGAGTDRRHDCGPLAGGDSQGGGRVRSLRLVSQGREPHNAGRVIDPEDLSESG